MFPPAAGGGGGGGGGEGLPPRLLGGTAAKLEGPLLLIRLLRRLSGPVPEGGGDGSVGGLGGGGVGEPLSSSIGYCIVLSKSSSLDMAIKRIVEQYTRAKTRNSPVAEGNRQK